MSAQPAAMKFARHALVLLAPFVGFAQTNPVSATKSSSPPATKSTPAATTKAAPPPAQKNEPAEITALRPKAERGNAIAQYNLGLAYAQGRGVPADVAEAFVWLTLASETGSTGKALETLLGTINNDQLAEGRRRLEALRASNPYLRPPPAVTRAVTTAEKSSAPAGPVPPSGPATSAPVGPGPASRDNSGATGSDETKRLSDQLAAAAQEKKQ